MTAAPPDSHKSASQPLLDFAAGEVCRAADGWHAVLRIGSVEHRIWSKQPLTAGAHYAAELPLDSSFEARAHAATRLWRAMNGRAPGPAFHRMSKQRRERLCAALRAVAAHFAGATYRSIAERGSPVGPQAIDMAWVLACRSVGTRAAPCVFMNAINSNVGTVAAFDGPEAWQ